jgi:hypothetical protein
MSWQPPPAGSLAERLADRRRRRFVGRGAEQELLRTALASEPPPFAVLHLHGPGGIGKTTLLEHLAHEAQEADATVVRIDGRRVGASPRSVLLEVGRTVEVPAGEAPIRAPAGTRLVLMLDAYERLAAIDDWLRTALLPRLPATALTVLAGRTPPGPAWRADPAWRELLRVVSLRNLAPAESREYLTGCGIDAALHDRIVALTHGHPLGLSLLADIVVRGGDVPDGSLAPDLVADLLASFIDAVPPDERRAALGACAIGRVVTEPLLREVLDLEDAHGVFGWLRGLSFVESGEDGLSPHDLARDTLDADLRWRDGEAYAHLFRRVAQHVRGRLRSTDLHEQRRAAFDLKYLFRHLPGIASPLDWESWASHHPEPARPDDADAVRDLIAGAEGPASAAIAQHWWERQPDGFFVVRGDDDEVRGVIVLLDLAATSDQDRAVDPGARAAWEHAHRAAPLRPGEAATQTRFVIDRDAYQDPSPTLNAVPVLTLQRKLATANLGWDHLTLHEPERWEEYFSLAGLERVRDADFEVSGRRYGTFAHDYRQVSLDDLMDLWVERALARDPQLRGAPEPASHVLSHAEFTEAVRQGLRDLTRPDLLGSNPLLRTRLLQRQADGPPDAASLARVLRSAVDSLRRHPRDDKLLRAVLRTYVEPAPTQEAAAARLGLPFSTYRRHLSQGVTRIVAWLWDQEVYGARQDGEGPAGPSTGDGDGPG